MSSWVVGIGHWKKFWNSGNPKYVRKLQKAHYFWQFKLEWIHLCWSVLPSVRACPPEWLCRANEEVKHSRETIFLMWFLMLHSVKHRVQPGWEHASIQAPLSGDELKAFGHWSQINRACWKHRITANIKYPEHPTVTPVHNCASAETAAPKNKICCKDNLFLSVSLKFISSGVNRACQCWEFLSAPLSTNTSLLSSFIALWT